MRFARSALLVLVACCNGSLPAQDGQDLSDPEVVGFCEVMPECDAPPPQVEPGIWTAGSSTFTAMGEPRHRGNDLLLVPGDEQWVIGKFAYGLFDKDLEHEEIDIYLLRGCGDTWEKLGTATTTDDQEHETVEGVVDNGGRVFFKIPEDKKLDIGRHRILMVPRGDLENRSIETASAEQIIEVVPQGTAFFVTDMDGTLTDFEEQEIVSIVTGEMSGIHEGAAEAFQILASKGYRPVYLSARPEWDMQRTREYIRARGLPPGIVRITQGQTGAQNENAVLFKSEQLTSLMEKGLIPMFGFGNRSSDAESFSRAGVPLQNLYMYQFEDEQFGAQRLESYTDLVPEFSEMKELCSE